MKLTSLGHAVVALSFWQSLVLYTVHVHVHVISMCYLTTEVLFVYTRVLYCPPVEDVPLTDYEIPLSKAEIMQSGMVIHVLTIVHTCIYVHVHVVFKFLIVVFSSYILSKAHSHVHVHVVHVHVYTCMVCILIFSRDVQ